MAKSKYYLITDNWDRIMNWKKYGATDKQICEQLNLSTTTWYEYLNSKPSFSEALKGCQKDFATELKGELARLATKHTLKTTKTTIRKDKETGEDISFTEVSEREVDGQLGAIHLLLNNVDRKDWNEDWSKLELKKEELELKKKLAEEKVWTE